MNEHILTIGLFDRDTEKQEVKTESAKKIICSTLINKYKVYAFTMIECEGCYKMDSTNRIVREPSIRVEIAAESDELTRETVYRMIADLKRMLNQESIMYKMVKSEIEFQ